MRNAHFETIHYQNNTKYAVGILYCFDTLYF
jgi:hypothetical protein